jgi:beta-phosphoglucomutase-like phosphatase (HAD superfamily)
MKKLAPPAYVIFDMDGTLVDNYRLWVIEDTSSGVAAGKTCGATVIGIRTSKTDEELRSAGADCTIGDYDELLKMMG